MWQQYLILFFRSINDQTVFHQYSSFLFLDLILFSFSFRLHFSNSNHSVQVRSYHQVSFTFNTYTYKRNHAQVLIDIWVHLQYLCEITLYVKTLYMINHYVAKKLASIAIRCKLNSCLGTQLSSFQQLCKVYQKYLLAQIHHSYVIWTITIYVYPFDKTWN